MYLEHKRHLTSVYEALDTKHDGRIPVGSQLEPLLQMLGHGAEAKRLAMLLEAELDTNHNGFIGALLRWRAMASLVQEHAWACCNLGLCPLPRYCAEFDEMFDWMALYEATTNHIVRHASVRCW